MILPYLFVKKLLTIDINCFWWCSDIIEYRSYCAERFILVSRYVKRIFPEVGIANFVKYFRSFPTRLKY